MDVVDIYDYYFLDRPYRRSRDSHCEFELCCNSIVYKRLATDETFNEDGYEYCDILEYMQYNASNETGLPAYYSCCMNYSGGHFCNAIPIMVGSRLEKKLIGKLCEQLALPFDRLYDEHYLHKVFASTFMTNGTFYYSVFRESNNNKICHNTSSKFRGEETVAYFYDMTYNRGIKLFTDTDERLKMNDRDGKEISNVTADTLAQLYTECLRKPQHYTLDTNDVVGYFTAVKRQGFTGIDDFKNKIYTNYSIALNTCLDRLHPTVVSHPKWNASLMTGRVNLGISQRLSYPKSKNDVKKQNEKQLKMSTGVMFTGYLVQSQRRRNTHNTKQTDGDNEAGEEIDEGGVEEKNDVGNVVAADANRGATLKCSQTVLGSNEMKVNGLIERLENIEKNGPSMFSQMTVSYLPFVRVLSTTVQKLQVEHVHAESSKTVPKDAAAFICMKYVGNISTAGKNMLFTSRVHVSYGHTHEVIENIENCITSLSLSSMNTNKNTLYIGQMSGGPHTLRIVINNAVTKYDLRDERHLLDVMVWLKYTVQPYVWIKLTGRYLCVYFFEGVPFLEYRNDEQMFQILNDTIVTKIGRRCLKSSKTMCFTRHELELIRRWTKTSCKEADEENLIKNEDDESYNRFVSRMFKSNGKVPEREHQRRKQREAMSSVLASQLDQYTDYTPPSKRSVSVNARKSACANVYFLKAASLIRGFSIFTDPDGYERKLAEQAYKIHGTPIRVTLEQFRLMREDNDNCPQPQGTLVTDEDLCHKYALRNFYMMRTIFADIDGYNVEDANVMDDSVDLCLRFSYSFSLTLFDETPRGVNVLIPPPEDCVRICGWDNEGQPSAVLFLVCMVRTDGSVSSNQPSKGNSSTKEFNQTNTCHKSLLGVVVGDSNVHFPPFRKLSVILNKDGVYHVYFIRNDAVLLRAIQKQRSHWLKIQKPNKSDPYRTVEEINPYYALDSLSTKVFRFTASKTNGGKGSVITIDFRAHGRTDKYDGIKVVNSFGQKGLAVIKDLQPYIADKYCETTATTAPTPSCAPVQLVMNVCSFVSRQPIGQYLQMKKNLSTEMESTAGEPCLVGFSPVFFTETEPTTKTCLVRLDEMMRSVIITNGLTTFQNVKSSLDNIYNLDGLLCPQHVRQILGLYRCYGVGYDFPGDTYKPYSTREDVQKLLNYFEICMKNIQETTGAERSIKDGRQLKRKCVNSSQKTIVKKHKI